MKRVHSAMKNHLWGLHKAPQKIKKFFKKTIDKSILICYNIVTVKKGGHNYDKYN